MNDLYLQLGRAMAGMCKPGFHRAALLAAMDEAGAALQLTYTLDDGSEWEPELSEDDRGTLRAALAAVRHAREQEEGTVWKTCTVVLTRGGGFELDVGY
jgi:acetoin utilization deacetylase AcuC-like enzyme